MSNEKLSKNHHYVPRSIIKRFCFSGNSTLLYDGRDPELGYRQRNVEKAFQKFHANTISTKDGGKSDFVEKWLAQQIDDPIAALLDNSRNDIGVIFQEESRKVLANYLATLVLRSPNTREALFQGNKWSLRAASLLFSIIGKLSPSTVGGFFGGNVPDDMTEALKIAVPTFLDEKTMKLFEDAQLTLCTPPNNSDVFCLGDFPLMRYDDPRNAVGDLCHEVWFVLSPTLAACFFFKTTLDVEGRITELPRHFVRRLNYDFAMRSRFVAASCPTQLHRTVKQLGRFPEERNLEETKPEMFLD